MAIDGKGPEQIARILEKDKVLTTKALYAKQSENHPDPKKRKKMPERPYHWIGQSVAGILERMEYTGCTCNFKTYSKSYKLKKRIPNAIEDMCIFPDTQEAIVSQAQWDRVQELRKNKRRPTKAERQGLFSGLLFCPDCGNKLHFATCKSFDGKQDHYVCSSYKSGRGTCSAHYIRKMYCGNWCWSASVRSIPISGRMWKAFRKNGCNAAVPIRNATSVRIGSEWSRPRNGWLTWMFFCPDFMRILSWAIW